MALLDIRQRAGHLFLVVMLGHVLLISAQVQSRSGVPVLEAAAFGLFAEVQRATSGGTSFFKNAWSGYVGLREVRSDNTALKAQLSSLEVQLQEQRALADRSRGLEQLLELRDQSNLRTAAAEIIAAGATPEFQTVTIDKGSLDGIKADMAVIAPGGVVGRVVISTPRAAKVQLIIDRNAAAGAIVERSRAQGAAVGSGESRLRMDFVPEVADVAQGDTVMTSGIDGIFPKGFVIGKVESVEKSGTAYKEILIRPAVDFASLEQVLVVLTPTPIQQMPNVDPVVPNPGESDAAAVKKP
ncbi:MAG TPA: rod shape-determining protein MreC [Vicinamibacterales bacterium]|jgi:rod shape-determining protein MreC|nr:rod shape-determining protein MreC [Vicinamibacterales bacterium]